jgi:uncharacterized protein YegL
MKENYCHISIVLDRSGSMAKISLDTIGGLNTFIEDQKNVDGYATVSLTQFDNIVENVFEFINLKDVNLDRDYRFIPRGMTALYDAIGSSIVKTGESLSKISESDRPSKVIFVIITDGEENASREYEYNKIQEMIKHQSDIYSWEFIFLGANIDAVSTAISLGIKGSNSITYAANSDGVNAVYGSVSSNLTAFRCASAIDASYAFFTQDDRDKQIRAGV